MEIKTNEIYTMRLTNNQEIVAKINHIDDNYYYMTSPLTIGQGKDGQMEFIPVMFCSEVGGDAAVLKETVGLFMPCRDDVKEVYEESLKPASEIITPRKQIITG